MNDLGKLLLVLGGIIILVGAALLLAGRFNLPLGRLPGDFVYRGKNLSFISSFYMHYDQHSVVIDLLAVWKGTSLVGRWLRKDDCLS